MSAEDEGRAALAIRRDDAEVRFERREGIVADLRRCARDGGQEGGFARVREADEAGIGDQPQFERDPARLARLAEFRHPGGLMRARHIVRVAEAAPPAMRDDGHLIRFGEVHDQFARLGVAHGRPGGTAIRLSAPRAPLRRLIAPLHAGPGLEVRGELEGQQAC